MELSVLQWTTILVRILVTYILACVGLPLTVFPCLFAGEKVAVKKITNIFEHVSDATRILREIKLLRMLKHPGGFMKDVAPVVLLSVLMRNMQRPHCFRFISPHLNLFLVCPSQTLLK